MVDVIRQASRSQVQLEGEQAPNRGASWKGDAVALRLLQALARATRRGRKTNVEELAVEVGVRKADCRATLSMLHREGYVDVLTMRPTMAGLALGAALKNKPLADLRAPKAPFVDEVAPDSTPSNDTPRTSQPPPACAA